MSDNGRPDSALKHIPQKELMEKYFAQIENAVYSAEIACKVPQHKRPNDWTHNFKCDCPFHIVFAVGVREWGMCGLAKLRMDIGDPVKQDDIITCESSEDVIGEEKERLK